MNVFEGALTDSTLFLEAAFSPELSDEEKSIIEENTWTEVQEAVDQNGMTREEAEVFMYQTHMRIQQVGGVVLRAS